jgi:GNAT superfamily N-acetyltransferase
LGSQRWSKDCGVLFCDKKKGKRIQAIYVLPGHQGKGIGGELMQKGLGFLGSGDIFIDVVSYNHKAFMRNLALEKLAKNSLMRCLGFLQEPYSQKLRWSKIGISLWLQKKLMS